ncbi:MAG: phytanoyl-CoA dioxygenase family protein [Rhodobacteraceae bacterium]|nr:phytanoyl-CoA dioxygenase family protein [Paracoccaceae bacterium]
MSDTLQLPLSLSFAPVVNQAPKRLSPSQVKGYNSLGFVQPFDVFSVDEIAEFRAYADGLMRDMGEGGAYGINCYQARLSGLYDIATDPCILDMVEEFLGPNFLCWASAILSKRPNDPKAEPWHQDASFWKLSPARTFTLWLAMDDADAENSAMRFIPSTHEKGAFDVRAIEGGKAVFHQETAGVDVLGDPFTNTLKAEQVSLHDDMLVHGSLPNASARRRCGLTLRYCPPEVQITDDSWAQGFEAILCRGDAKEWRTFPQPENNDITAMTSPHVVGNN